MSRKPVDKLIGITLHKPSTRYVVPTSPELQIQLRTYGYDRDSKFLDRFFPRSPSEDEQAISKVYEIVNKVLTEDKHPAIANTSPLIRCNANNRPGGSANGQNGTRHDRTHINAQYNTQSPSFMMGHVGRYVRYMNSCEIWLDTSGPRVVPLGFTVHLPSNFVAVTVYETPGLGYACPTDFIEPQNANPEVQIINLLNLHQVVGGGWIRGRLYAFPYFIPEPWETANVDPPVAGDPFFVLRSDVRITLKAKSSDIVRINATHMCTGSYSALVIGTRNMNRQGTLVDPIIWIPGTAALLRITNTTLNDISYPPRTAIARVLFSVVGFTAMYDMRIHSNRIRCPTSGAHFKYVPR